MGQPMLPEAKVKILVETWSGVDIIDVPLAVKPELGSSRTYDLEGHPANEHHIGFSCYALYDIDQNLIVKQDTKVGVNMEDVILSMARDILRKKQEQ